MGLWEAERSAEPFGRVASETRFPCMTDPSPHASRTNNRKNQPVSCGTGANGILFQEERVLFWQKDEADGSVGRYHLASNPMATALSGAPVNARGQHRNQGQQRTPGGGQWGLKVTKRSECFHCRLCSPVTSEVNRRVDATAN